MGNDLNFYGMTCSTPFLFQFDVELEHVRWHGLCLDHGRVVVDLVGDWIDETGARLLFLFSWTIPVITADRCFVLMAGHKHYVMGFEARMLSKMNVASDSDSGVALGKIIYSSIDLTGYCDCKYWIAYLQSKWKSKTNFVTLLKCTPSLQLVIKNTFTTFTNVTKAINRLRPLSAYTSTHIDGNICF